MTILIFAISCGGGNGKNANKMIVTSTPEQNRIKSKGLNIPKINCPFFVFAGIK